MLSNRMWWPAGLGVVALCATSGLIGLMAGVNLNPESTVRFIPNWGVVGSLVSAAMTAVMALVAVMALSSWRAQERQRLILQWKTDLASYTWTLPYLKQVITEQTEKADVERIAAAFYECVKSYVVMMEVLKSDKLKECEGVWRDASNAHLAFIGGKATRDETKDIFAKLCLEKLL